MERKDFFFKIIGEELTNDGFKFIKSKNGFIKKENNNEFLFYFTLWSPFFAEEAHIDIIIGEIEQIKKKAWGALYKKYITIGTHKSLLKEYLGEGIVKTDTDEKLNSAAQGEIHFYYSYAKEYFKKHLDYNYLDQLLNNRPGEELFLAYNPIHTTFLAIIVAKLNGNIQFEELLSFYREIIIKHNFNYLEEYDLLSNYLQGNQ